MKRILYSFIFLLIIASSGPSFYKSQGKSGPRLSQALTENNRDKFIVWIYFTDKGPNAFQTILNPLNVVSQRSIDRRLKVKSHSNVIDYSDIPVYKRYVTEIEKAVSKIRQKSKWLNAISAEINRTQINSVADLEFVSKIELVERYKRVKENEEFNIETNQNDNSGHNGILIDTLNYGTGSSLTQITQINVNQVHNDGIFGQGILIANFDAGFSNLTHEVFTTYPMNIVSTYDFQNHTPVLAGHSHGTATLSLVGGYKPGELIGPAFKSDFILARTEVDPTETPAEMDNWIAAAEWADSLGADVITSSLGYLDFDPPHSSYTWQDMNGNTLPVTIAADIAVNKGIVVSNSAGNNGIDVNNTLIGPADGDSVITVGAVNSTGVRSSFSSVGPTTDVPPRFKPDVMAMGSNNYVAGTSGNTYYNGSGTSFSCPINSGVCALILSANKFLTPIQVRDILRKFGSNSNTPNNLIGWGIIDAKESVDTARKLDNSPPVIEYSQLFSTIIKPAPVKVKCLIKDNGIIRSRINEAPLLYYRKYTSSWSAFIAVNSYSSNADTFYFSIPGSSQKALVEYYFAAQDIALPSPLMATLPSGGSGINPPGNNPPPVRFRFKVNPFGYSSTDNLEKDFQINNYPNPFNPGTVISYQLPVSSYVSLKVFDVLGKEIKELVNVEQEAGNYKITFDGKSFSSGIYFYKIETDNFSITKQMLLLK